MSIFSRKKKSQKSFSFLAILKENKRLKNKYEKAASKKRIKKTFEKRERNKSPIKPETNIKGNKCRQEKILTPNFKGKIVQMPSLKLCFKNPRKSE